MFSQCTHANGSVQVYVLVLYKDLGIHMSESV